jgi:hypothetical protein
MSHFLKASQHVVMLRGGLAQPGRASKHARHPMQRILAQPQWRVTPFEYNALNYDDNDLKIVQIILYASGAFETGPGGLPADRWGDRRFNLNEKFCCRFAAGAARAPRPGNASPGI